MAADPHLDFVWEGDDGRPAIGALRFLDETLRDGLQSPSVRHPSLDEKIELLYLMDRIGASAANVGYPGAGARAQGDAAALCREIESARLSLRANCAGRTAAEDIVPAVEVAQQAGAPLEIGMFLASSPIRRFAEGWTLDAMLRVVEQWVGFARANGLDVLFVTEDTTRARPEDVARLCQTAVRAGAQRICLADTVGCATPVGVRALVGFVRASLDAAGGGKVGLDWHGHNDRGLAVANALTAARAGADRLHGTALGVGERVGNASMEHLLVNAALLGWAAPGLEAVPAYLEAASGALRTQMPLDTHVLLRSAAFTRVWDGAAAGGSAAAAG